MVNRLLDESYRSYMMSRIKSKDSEMERLVFRDLRARGISFQKHYGRVPGTPDVAKPRLRRAVFIDGDFWHGRHLDRVRTKHGADSYWVAKLERNVERDRAQEQSLRQMGWSILRIWDSDLRRKATRLVCLDEIATFLSAANEAEATEGAAPPAP
ncbi:very short patch repair endonuclease [Salinibacterium sp. ZJ450]|uniref:very short patch repair endonuclease n=1 Tax=Salinibacterium sp. ZJ450 TaxID=2708338 RepID=UPI00142265CB|nr:very short patch repair endonuclease [Salinibacterium sp. ZJ450]